MSSSASASFGDPASDGGVLALSLPLALLDRSEAEEETLSVRWRFRCPSDKYESFLWPTNSPKGTQRWQKLR